MNDQYGAFVPGSDAEIEGSGNGPLHGVRIAVKDLIDIKGTVTGGGNPDWASDQQPAAQHAWAVEKLLMAGASICGKTITDELAFSLEGDNWHYGTPVNPRCPECLPGGSSSGSAVAVAAGLADAALGTDTGGSVRIPAAFCGLFGFRPTHGRIPLHGVIPFSPYYDTVGWFARSAEMLERVGHALLDTQAVFTYATPSSLILASDVFSLVDPACSALLLRAAVTLGAHNAVQVLDGGVDRWTTSYQILQGAEIHQSLAPWIRKRKPLFGPNIAPRFAQTLTLDHAEVARQTALRQTMIMSINRLLKNGTILVLPTSPTTALPLDATSQTRAEFYRVALAINAVSGHAGVPQITTPVGLIDGRPIGLSFIAAHGGDEMLLRTAIVWSSILNENGFESGKEIASC